MIIQCEECSTRFRLADEKLKPTGTKVRCSKCKHVFTVMPPEPEPSEELPAEEPAPQPPATPSEPEAASSPPAEEDASSEQDDEGIDFDAMNMEAVPSSDSEEDPDKPAEDMTDSAPELDFSGLEEEMASQSPESEYEEEFSFSVPDTSTAEEDGPEEAESSQQATDVEDEPGGSPVEYDFDASNDSHAFAFEEPPESDDVSGEFSLGDSQSDVDDSPGEFSFDEPDETSLALDDENDTAGISLEEPPSDDDAQAFSFDDASAFDESASERDDFSMEWEDSPEENAFDFDEPDFGTAPGPAATEKEQTEDKGESLQFGEIDFPKDGGEDSPSFDSGTDFAGATLASEEESLDVPPAPLPKARRNDDADDAPLPAPPVKRKKSPLGRIVLLLILLLLTLGAAAGYFYFWDGSFDIGRLLDRFNQSAQQTVQESKISVNFSPDDLYYVNNKGAGQLLVVPGVAVNNYPTARSAITIKGSLLDAAGNTLFQQTVFCGNQLDRSTLRNAPFSKIEEAMNNQFGDSLSNMNVASGATIPFTIVFRNLPDNMASIKVEVVDSKPGG